MDKVQKDLDRTQRILQDNMNKLLHRGESLQDLSKKVDDLREFTSLFKKQARQIRVNEESKLVIPNLSLKKSLEPDPEPKFPVKENLDDYSTSIEDTDISEYIKQLIEYYEQGEYQYVLDKFSQLGLVDYVKQLLSISEEIKMNLDLADALTVAAYYGHVEVVEELLNNDIDNERFFGKEPRVATESILPFLSSQFKIPYINKPLTHDNLRRSILSAHAANHLELAKVLETYYYRTHAIKDRHDISKADILLGKM